MRMVLSIGNKAGEEYLTPDATLYATLSPTLYGQGTSHPHPRLMSEKELPSA
jgi:hypothetical protein